MASFNKVLLIGNLGKDPQVSFGQSGAARANFSIATSESWTDGAGEKKERTDWHNIVVFGKQAEACGKYLTKGKMVHVEGRIQNRSYEKDGQTKYITEIVANHVTFLSPKDSSSGSGSGSRKGNAAPPPDVEPGEGPQPGDDDIPF